MKIFNYTGKTECGPKGGKTPGGLLLVFLALVLLSPLPSFAAEADEGNKPSVVPGLSINDLGALFEKVHKTGVAPGNIPPVNRPLFLTVSDASLSMDDREQVFILQYPDGKVRIYPQRIMVWHEVVNDVLPDTYTRARQGGGSGDAYTLTYSPLTGAVVAFKSMAGRYPSTFAALGSILNANSMLYDRVSGSSWSQLLAVCLDGPMKNKRLERVPVLWATWGGARKVFPNAEVLSRATGTKRRYGEDPYGSYINTGNYYDNLSILFPVLRRDNRLPPKRRILGLEIGELYVAVDKPYVQSVLLLNFNAGLTPLLAVYDPALDAVRVFERKVPPMARRGETVPVELSFKFFEGKYIDEQSRSEWLPDGSCAYGRYAGQSLKPVLAVDSMWFAWSAFHPLTEIVGNKDEIDQNIKPLP